MVQFGDPKTEHQVTRAKRMNYAALFVLFGLLATSFYFFLELQSKKAELVEKTLMLADSTENLRRIRAELEAAQRNLQAREDSTIIVLDSITNLVQKRDFDAAEEVVNVFQDKDRFPRINANLYTFGVSDSEKRAVANYLAEEHVRLAIDTTLTTAPSWLTNQSTVFYYEAKSESTARTLAKGLTAHTKMAFQVVLGSPSEAPRYTRGEYFNIHFVNPTKVVRQKEIQSQIFQQKLK